MARRSIDIDWGAIVVIIIVLSFMTSIILADWHRANLIDNCITSKGQPVIEHGELKECKR